MSKGNVQGNMSRSQNVGRTASRTQREGCDATAAQPTHGDADAACNLYTVYTATSIIVRQSYSVNDH